jgi:hypothetical protein
MSRRAGIDPSEWTARLSVRLGEFAPVALLLLLAGFLVSGCGATPAAPAAGTVPPLNVVDPQVVRAVLDWFVANKHLVFRTTGADARAKRFDAHKGFFVVRRARWLLAHGPAAWGTEPSHATVIGRVDSEFAALEDYTNRRLGTPKAPGPILTGTGDRSPVHLDVTDIARRRSTDPAVTVAQALATRDTPVKRLVVDILTERRERAMAVIWRAGGIHANLWQAAADLRTATLREAAMDEVLDRRLHAVERMSYQISRADAMGANRINTSAGPHGPWTDGLRVRMFEYPRLDKTYVPALGTIASEGAPMSTIVNGQPSGPEWRWESASHRRVVWNMFPGHRFRSAAENALPLVSGTNPANYWHALAAAAGLTPAQAMDALYTPSTNYWDRSWVYCDHVVSSLHLMALLFGKRRRTGGDAWFNDVVTSHAQGYVQLGPLLRNVSGAPGPGRLMDSGPEPDPDLQPPPPPPDPAFQNALIHPADIEIGDHLIFWNSVLYPLVSNGEWQLENALVVGIESNPDEGSVRLDKLRMQGHGTVALTVGQYEDMIGGHLQVGMVDARQAAAGAPAGTNALTFNGVADRLVRWSPYPQPWSDPGAWWVRVPVGHETHTTVRDRLRKGVMPSPAFPNPAPFADSVYFPLWEPQYRDGWAGYLADRAAGAVRVSPRLRAVPIDGSIIPGLHYAGATWDPLPIVRPRVTP